MIKSRRFVHKTGFFQIDLTISETRNRAGYSLYCAIVSHRRAICKRFSRRFFAIYGAQGVRWNVRSSPFEIRSSGTAITENVS